MEFQIDVEDSRLPLRRVIYNTTEYSFDTIPYDYYIDFEIEINMIVMSVVEGCVVQLNGFSGLGNALNTSYSPPVAHKGILKVLNSDTYECGVGSYAIDDIDWPVFINPKAKWVCIGSPQCKGETVEFLTNCIAVIDKSRNLKALWIYLDILNCQ